MTKIHSPFDLNIYDLTVYNVTFNNERFNTDEILQEVVMFDYLASICVIQSDITGPPWYEINSSGVWVHFAT